jgi:hypothetical protein
VNTALASFDQIKSLIWESFVWVVVVIIFFALGCCLFNVTGAFCRWFDGLFKPKDERVTLRQIWSESAPAITALGLVLAFFGWSFARDFYNRVFIDQPVAYKETNQKSEIHRRGTYLGLTDHVDFCLWGPRQDEEDFDDWQVVAEMQIPGPDLISSLPQLARAASLHGYNRVVLLPNKDKALVVDSESKDDLIMEVKEASAERPGDP